MDYVLQVSHLYLSFPASLESCLFEPSLILIAYKVNAHLMKKYDHLFLSFPLEGLGLTACVGWMATYPLPSAAPQPVQRLFYYLKAIREEDTTLKTKTYKSRQTSQRKQNRLMDSSLTSHSSLYIML